MEPSPQNRFSGIVLPEPTGTIDRLLGATSILEYNNLDEPTREALGFLTVFATQAESALRLTESQRFLALQEALVAKKKVRTSLVKMFDFHKDMAEVDAYLRQQLSGYYPAADGASTTVVLNENYQGFIDASQRIWDIRVEESGPLSERLIALKGFAQRASFIPGKVYKGDLQPEDMETVLGNLEDAKKRDKMHIQEKDMPDIVYKNDIAIIENYLETLAPEAFKAAQRKIAAAKHM